MPIPQIKRIPTLISGARLRSSTKMSEQAQNNAKSGPIIVPGPQVRVMRG
jgi:hypothetical protein